jgi:hypothetical protein
VRKYLSKLPADAAVPVLYSSPLSFPRSNHRDFDAVDGWERFK